MEPFTTHRGLVAVMDRPNVDTDQIIPKQFLKRIERTGFGQFLFFDWRFNDDGSDKPDFELNLPCNKGASVLIAGRNFGSGSSREHAVWALADFGIRCVIAESYSDIFFNNCYKNGVLPIELGSEQVKQLMDAKKNDAGFHLTIDLGAEKITDGRSIEIPFGIDPVRKDSMINGLDDIGLTMKHVDKISAFEEARNKSLVS